VPLLLFLLFLLLFLLFLYFTQPEPQPFVVLRCDTACSTPPHEHRQALVVATPGACVTSSAFERSLRSSANPGLMILYFLKQRSRSKASYRDATLAADKLIRDHMDRSSHAPSPNTLFFRCLFFGILPRTGPGATKWKYPAADGDRDGVKMQPKHAVAPRHRRPGTRSAGGPRPSESTYPGPTPGLGGRKINKRPLAHWHPWKALVLGCEPTKPTKPTPLARPPPLGSGRQSVKSGNRESNQRRKRKRQKATSSSSPPPRPPPPGARRRRPCSLQEGRRARGQGLGAGGG
jgi:hypothetical protein